MSLYTGAVVAREYGLPCVVGAVNATSILKFGDMVTLNAGKGFVVKVDEADRDSDDVVTTMNVNFEELK